jgi:hypothetical protein
MDAQDIEVERNEAGIFTYARSAVLGGTERVMIWGVQGEVAREYRNKDDEEIRQIAYGHWRRMTISFRRRKKDE